MKPQDMCRSVAGPLLFGLARLARLRPLCLNAAFWLEGGPFYSLTARDILDKDYGVVVGAYSYGQCFIPGAFPPGVTVGRYVSIAPGVRIFLRNHPTDRLSTHPFFFNRVLGWVAEDAIATGTLVIGHDAWIGANTILTPGCSQIGIGAVVGAGAVVTKDVPDFAIAVGCPARVVRLRFPEAVCERVRSSQWWEHSVDECAQYMPDMVRAIGDQPETHPLLRQAFSETPVVR
jgi:virginiamycin A acetyltransferase